MGSRENVREFATLDNLRFAEGTQHHHLTLRDFYGNTLHLPGSWRVTQCVRRFRYKHWRVRMEKTD